MLRLANADDLPFLKEMLFEAIYWDPDGERPPMEEVLSQDLVSPYCEDWPRSGDAGLIAVDDDTNRPMGAAWYRLVSKERPTYGFIDEQTPELTIAVVEEYRGKHIGSGLMDALKKMAKAQGHQRLGLVVSPRNLKARFLYAKMGFREIKHDDEAISMVLNLGTPGPAGTN